MIFKFITKSPAQTKKLGELWAKKFIKKDVLKRAVLICLKGDLGGGKTTFLQGFARGLKIKEKILSPTFIIVKRFQVSGSKFQDFYHLDCYRIKNQKEILNLSFKKMVFSPQNIVAIEWADKIKNIIPRDAIWINFKFINKNKREIVIKI